MKRAATYSLIALVLVLGLTLPIATLVMGSDSLPSKHRDPDDEPYDVGDTIHYVMSVTNSGGAINYYDRVWDDLPDGSIHWFVEEGVDPVLVLDPGENATFYLNYVVDWDDVEWIEPPVGEPYWGIRNVFQAEGIDSSEEDIDDRVEDVAEVTPFEPVGGEAFPIGKPSILAPWIVLGAAILAGAAVFVRRRRASS